MFSLKGRCPNRERFARKMSPLARTAMPKANKKGFPYKGLIKNDEEGEAGRPEH